MPSLLDENGIEYYSHNDRVYYNRTYSARYVGMTDTGFRRKIKKIEVEQGIVVPLVNLPKSAQNKYIDKRVLDVFRKSVKVGREREWFNELRRIIDLVNSED
jgi:hypothetical protein